MGRFEVAVPVSHRLSVTATSVRGVAVAVCCSRAGRGGSADDDLPAPAAGEQDERRVDAVELAAFARLYRKRMEFFGNRRLTPVLTGGAQTVPTIC